MIADDKTLQPALESASATYIALVLESLMRYLISRELCNKLMILRSAMLDHVQLCLAWRYLQSSSANALCARTVPPVQLTDLENMQVPPGHERGLVYYGAHCLIWVGIVICIVGTFIGIFICNPVKRAWNPFVPSHCLNSKTVLTVISAIRIVIEFQILALPFTAIWKLVQ